MAPPYRIIVTGALDDSGSARFDDLALARELGLTLVAAERRAATPAACRSGQPDDP